MDSIFVRCASPAREVMVLTTLTFYFADIITESTQAPKKSKNQLEQIVTANGGKIFQTNIAAEDMICVGDRRQSSALLTLPYTSYQLNFQTI